MNASTFLILFSAPQPAGLCYMQYKLSTDHVVFMFADRHRNKLSVNPTKWSNTLKTIRQQQPTNCLSVFDHFVGLAIKRLIFWRGLSCTFRHVQICVKYPEVLQDHLINLIVLKMLITDKAFFLGCEGLIMLSLLFLEILGTKIQI